MRPPGSVGSDPGGRDAGTPTIEPGCVYAMRYTRNVAKTVPVREFRTKLSELLSDVADRRDHVLVTRNGKPAAALVPIDEYDALEETAEILSDPDAIAAIEAGLAELERDETVTLEDLRRELAERRPPRWAVARVVLARRARLVLLGLYWPLIDAIEDALGLLERDPG